MFVFGCTCSIAYLFKRISYSLLAKKLLKGFVRTIIAFYVSGIAFTILVAERWSATSIIEILTFIELCIHLSAAFCDEAFC